MVSQTLNYQHCRQEESAGMVMLFTLVTAMQEKLSERADQIKTIREEKQQKEAEVKVIQEQAKLDAEYEKQKEHYETVVIPEYNDALNTWNVIQEKKISFLEEELKYNNEALNDLYDTSKLISARYRELWILQLYFFLTN